MIADRRVWRTETGEIVADGDPAARFLVAGQGCEVPLEHREAVAEFVAAAGADGDKIPTKKAELIVWATARGIDVDPSAKVADIRAAVDAALADTGPAPDAPTDGQDGAAGPDGQDEQDDQDGNGDDAPTEE